jgi:hypothetical protein
MAGSSGGPKRVTQIVLDITPLQPELPCEPRYRSRLVGKKSEQIFSKHRADFTCFGHVDDPGREINWRKTH